MFLADERQLASSESPSFHFSSRSCSSLSCALSIFADKVCAAFPQRVITRTLPLHAAVPVYIAAIAGAEASIAFAGVSPGMLLDALVSLVAPNNYHLPVCG